MCVSVRLNTLCVYDDEYSVYVCMCIIYKCA